MTLHRDILPALDSGGWLEIGPGIRVTNGPPRQVEGIDRPGLLKAFEKACASIWGFHWRAPFEEVCGLAKGATKEWQRHDQIPPVMILGWIAWAAAQDDRRALGALVLGISRVDSQGTLDRAVWLAAGLSARIGDQT